MISRDRESQLKSVHSFGQLLVDDCGPCLSREDAENIVADNLVLVTAFEGVREEHTDGWVSMDDRGGGTGLQLTTDGFILTAYHNIEEYIPEWDALKRPSGHDLLPWLHEMRSRYAVVDQEGYAYAIDPTFHVGVPQLDIALIKAFIDREPEPFDIRISDTPPAYNDSIQLVTLDYQQLYRGCGTVLDDAVDQIIEDRRRGRICLTYDTFKADIPVRHGMSGGPFIDPDGKVNGMVIYTELNDGEDAFGLAGGAKGQYINALLHETYGALCQKFLK